MHRIFKPIFERRCGLSAACAILVFAGLGFGKYLGAGRDDTFITLWAGENLALGNGLINYNHEPLEISSSLLHTLVAAALARIAPEHLFFLNKAAGLLAGCLVILLVWRYRENLHFSGGSGFFAYVVVLAMLCTTPGFLYWNLGGLETPFAALLLLLAGLGFLLLWERPSTGRIAGLVAVQGACLAVRPEMFYLIPFSAIFLLLYRGSKDWDRKLWWILAGPAMIFSGLGFFRLIAFNAWFPNPVYAKSSSLTGKLEAGWNYIAAYYASSPLLFLMGLVLAGAAAWFGWLLFRSVAQRARLAHRAEGGLIFLLGLAATVHLFVLFCGGDWMEYFRFMQPVFPLSAILSMTLFARFTNWCAGRVEMRISPLAGKILKFAPYPILALLVFMNLDQKSLVKSRQGGMDLAVESALMDYDFFELISEGPGLDERVKELNKAYARDKEALFPFLDSAIPVLCQESGGLVIATPQMGIFPYYLKKRFPDLDLYFIDTYGLCDKTAARLPMEGGTFGLEMGFNLAPIMDGKAGPLSEYVLSLRPNLLYRLAMGRGAFATLGRLGFKHVLKAPQANIFYRPGRG